MKLPTIHSKVLGLDMGDYEVFVVTLDPNDPKEFPQYAVINSTTKVIECSHNNLFYIKDWLKYAQTELNGGEDKATAETLPFAKAN